MISICSRIAAPLAVAVCLVAGPVSAEDLEEIVGQHMVAEALLTAHLVAVTEKAGLGNEEIRAILKDVADNSAIDEFWITDPEGHAVLANREIQLHFRPDPTKQPQASAFWGMSLGGEPLYAIPARVGVKGSDPEPNREMADQKRAGVIRYSPVRRRW
jgi:hypothetical protein